MNNTAAMRASSPFHPSIKQKRRAHRWPHTACGVAEQVRCCQWLGIPFTLVPNVAIQHLDAGKTQAAHVHAGSMLASSHHSKHERSLSLIQLLRPSAWLRRGCRSPRPILPKRPHVDHMSRPQRKTHKREQMTSAATWRLRVWRRRPAATARRPRRCG